jgi:hypothetical protein
MAGRLGTTALLGLVLGWLVVACDDGPKPSANTAPMGVSAEEARPAAAVTRVDEEEPTVREPEVEMPANQPPRFTAVQVDPAPNISANSIVRVDAHAVDPEGGDIEYTYRWLVNDWETDHQGSQFDASKLKRGDTVQVIVVASDGFTESDEVKSPVLTVTNGAPVILSKPLGTGPDGVFRYQIRAEDPDQDRNLLYKLEESPRGMTVTPGGGLVMWKPTQSQSGTHPVHIVVEDSEGARADQTFELTIHPATS